MVYLGLGEKVLALFLLDGLLWFCMSFWTWFGVVLLGIFFFHLHMKQIYGVFDQLGIPYVPPIWIFGSLHNIIFKEPREFDMQAIAKYGKVFGVFSTDQADVMVADPEILKDIFVKDFQYFANRRDLGFDLNESSLVSHMLTVTHGERWKNIRNTITPAFTGGKLRHMTPLINRCIDNLCDLCDETASGPKKMDVHKFFGGLSMDVIASCAFATEVNSIRNPDNDLVKNSKAFFDSDTFGWMMLLMFLFPNVLFRLLPKLGVQFFGSMNPEAFFKPLLAQLLEDRRKNPQKYADFLQLMIDSSNKSGGVAVDYDDEKDQDDVVKSDEFAPSEYSPLWATKKHPLTDEEIMAQSLLFLIAGYHTTAATLTFTLYSLAQYREIQKKCVEELQHATQGEDVVTYDTVRHKLPYLESVVLETLRMYPAATRTDRQCIKDYEAHGIKILKGMTVTVPIYAIQHSPEYYPDPEKFDPNRFSPEEKARRDPFTFLAFGAGPRNCVGMRFALNEIKMTLANILMKFEFHLLDDAAPMRVKDFGLLTTAEPVWLGVRKRNVPLK